MRDRPARARADESAQRYRAVFDTGAIGIVELDRRARMVDANPAFLRLGGWTAADVDGNWAGALVDRAARAAHSRPWLDLVAGRCSRYVLPTSLRRADGSMAVSDVTMTAVRDTGGATLGAVAVVLPVAVAPTDFRRPAPVELPTAAELAVLRGLASGLTLQQLAGRLGLTRRGVDYRLARLRHKLRADEAAAGPATTAGVVARGYAVGLLELDAWPPTSASG